MDIVTYIPTKPTQYFDVMVKGKFYITLKFILTVGLSYGDSDLKKMTRLKLPSLAKKDFELIPTMSPLIKR